MIDTKQIKLIVFDTKKNFDNTKNFFGDEGASFKNIINVENESDFEKVFYSLQADDMVFLVVHAFHLEKIKGIKHYISTNIKDKYPGIGGVYISDGNRQMIKQELIRAEIPYQEVYKYHQIRTLLEGPQKVYTKKEIEYARNAEHQNPTSKYPQFDYAVLTALYTDEFEELKKVFEFLESDEIKTDTKTYFSGNLRSDPSKKIIAAFQSAAGMVDASIIATQMLEFFRPKYIFMTGVCGGSTEHNFGDVIIANQIFTFQKGKLSDIELKNEESGEFEPIDLYDKLGKPISYNELYDKNGSHITINIEKFEPDNESAIELDSAISDILLIASKDISDKITAYVEENSFFATKKEIAVKLAPLACSTMVINRTGFFEDTIRSIHRKTAAVEMESYGVARACKFANEGKTIPIIFKSVMDHTAKKADYTSGINYKKFAAHTSAQFLKNILEMNLLP